ncbi:MAG: ATP-binding protein [Chloroflexi bacterium]|nr:ATP-binding protein [Chloroflexota bacterium]MDL1943394.1 ATP-binding protein [Chloroflexi bacterium CFX2]
MPSYTFPARFEFLDEIREVVAQVARAGGFSEKTIYSLQLAADEASSNIIEHAYEGESDASLDLVCEMRGNEIVIILRDWGKSFDPSGVKDPNLSADLSSRQVGGLGMYLMRKLMDTVRYESNARTGNLLIMTKRRE